MKKLLARITMALLFVGFVSALGAGGALAQPSVVAAPDSVAARQEMLQVSMNWIRQFRVVPLDDTNPLPIAAREHGPICVRYSGTEIGPISPICFDGDDSVGPINVHGGDPPGQSVGQIGVGGGPRFVVSRQGLEDAVRTHAWLQVYHPELIPELRRIGLYGEICVGVGK